MSAETKFRDDRARSALKEWAARRDPSAIDDFTHFMEKANVGERYAQILAYRYGIGDQKLSVEDIARKYGIQRERVRQLQAQGERKLGNLLL